jgi:hypothetical protein
MAFLFLNEIFIPLLDAALPKPSPQAELWDGSGPCGCKTTRREEQPAEWLKGIPNRLPAVRLENA